MVWRCCSAARRWLRTLTTPVFVAKDNSIADGIKLIPLASTTFNFGHGHRVSTACVRMPSLERGRRPFTALHIYCDASKGDFGHIIPLTESKSAQPSYTCCDASVDRFGATLDRKNKGGQADDTIPSTSAVPPSI